MEKLRGVIGVIRKEISGESNIPLVVGGLKNLAFLIATDDKVGQRLEEGVKEGFSSVYYSNLRRLFSGREGATFRLSVESSGFGEGFGDIKLGLTEVGWGKVSVGFRGKDPIIDFVPDPKNSDVRRVDKICRHLKGLERNPRRQVDLINKAITFASGLRTLAIWGIHAREGQV